MKRLLTLCLLLIVVTIQAQIPDYIYKPNIRTVTLNRAGDNYSYPVLALNSGEQLELHFDDLDGGVKNYYYSFLLCNSDWRPSSLTTFDYVKGFQNVRLTNYRNSSIAFTRYTHYQAMLPERNSVPYRSGNYLLLVFLDGDTSKLVFTKRFLVYDNKASIIAQVKQPFGALLFNDFQRLFVAVTLDSKINVFNQQDIKVDILQNYSWYNSSRLNTPTIFRGNYFEYNEELYSVFPGGKEWRWIDLRSLRLMSDRVLRIEKKKDSTDIYIKPDGERKSQPYLFYRDYDGLFSIENMDNVNPYWQGDYAKVHFTFFPPGNRPYEGRSVHIYGGLTNFRPSDSSKMIFNEERGAYERTLFLKQGYYNYSYLSVPDARGAAERFSFDNTEGNYWATENSYIVLVYYRAFGSRADELIGFALVNSFFQR